MRKIGLGILITSVGLIALTAGGLLTFAQTENPLSGKIIALDACHGGNTLGAQYPATCADDGDPSDCQIYEKDVNLAVTHVLKGELEANGAKVVLSRECNETISTNKARADTAVEKCKLVDVNGDGQADGRKCDVLVSVHHNGSVESSHDGTMVIYNERQDKPLAIALHDSLISSLGLTDEGYDNGGYGMTVFDHLVSALTESYYITNTAEADYYLAGATTTVCQNSDGSDYKVRIGDRVNQEADTLYQGLLNYFSISPTKPGSK